MSDMVKLTGLWQNQSKNGENYLSGNLGGARVMIFKNKYKREGSKDPDFNLFVAAKQQQQDGGAGGSHYEDDDIPF